MRTEFPKQTGAHDHHSSILLGFRNSSDFKGENCNDSFGGGVDRRMTN